MLAFLHLAVSAGTAASALLPAPVINTTYLMKQVTPLRQQLILDYLHQHTDPAASSIFITPRMVVIHWTAISSLKSTLAAFGPDVLSGREDIQRGGKLNTGAQFLVDRDGTIYQLSAANLFQRHTIGLNGLAIGIENVGSGPLSAAQLRANTLLVNALAHQYPSLQYLIGHFEYGTFRGSALWHERDPSYFTIKSDPGPVFMKNLRGALAQARLRLKSAP